MSAENTSDGLLRIVLVLIAAIIFVPILIMLFAIPLMWGGGMMGGYGMYGTSSWWGVIIPLIWLVVFVGVGYLIYRWLSGDATMGEDPALEELRLAYARGEMSDEEFENRREKLETE